MGKELENEAGARVGYMLVLEGGHIVRWCLIRDSKGWRSEPNRYLRRHVPREKEQHMQRPAERVCLA